MRQEYDAPKKLGDLAGGSGSEQPGFGFAMSRLRQVAWFCWILGAAAFFASGASFAQDSPAKDEKPRLAAQEAQDRLDRAQASTALDDAAKKPLVEGYTAALEQLKREQEFQSQAARYAAQIDASAGRIKEIDGLLGAARETPKAEGADKMTVVEVMQMASEKQSALTAAQNAQKACAEEPARRAKRRQEIPQQIFDLIKPRQEAQPQLDLPKGESESEEAFDARRAQAQARIQSIDAERDAYEKELAWYDASVSLLFLEQDLADRQLSDSQAQYDVWNRQLSAKREQEAQRASDEALKAYELATQQDVPWVRALATDLANDTKDLTQRLSGPDGLLAKIEAAKADVKASEELQQKLNEDFKDVRRKTEDTGASSGVGLLLRTLRRDLPDSGEIEARAAKHNDTIAEAESGKTLRVKQRRELGDIDASAGRIADRLSAEQPKASGRTTDSARSAVRGLFRDLYTKKRETIVKLIENYDEYIKTLIALQEAERNLAGKADEFAAYIDERVLWVQSASPLSFGGLADIPRSAVWLVDPAHWRSCGRGWADDLASKLPLYLLAFSLAILYLVAFLRLSRRLSAYGELASRRLCQTFTPTAKATAITLLLGAGPALAAGFLGWRLDVLGFGAQDDEFGRALGDALWRSVVPLLILGWVWYVLCPRGLAESHFDWPGGLLRSIRRRIGLAAALQTLLLFPVTLLEWASDEQMLAALGRPLFIAAMGVMAWLSHSLLKKSRGPVPRLLAALSEQRRTRVARIWHLGAIGVPLALMGLACAGYLYTAIRLSWRFQGTLLLLLGLFLVRGLAMRSLSMVRRRMAREQARRRREQRSAEEDGEEFEEAGTLDLEAVDTQTQGAVRSLFGFLVLLGLWVVWADVLPALGVLDRVELWSVTGEVSTRAPETPESAPQAVPAEPASAAAAVVVAKSAPEPAKETAPKNRTEVTRVERIPITLARLLLTVLVAALTFIVVRNLPGLLEVTVLRRLSLAAGERYAITAIVSYAISATGLVVAFSMLGVGWSKVQWLVAAMGVGLGFGLQEIFANFVSGIIMLFERPVRVGDTVTINGMNGTVTRIRIRATRILDWDGKEIIVPNKEFIMGPLINWTLSNPSVRLVIPIGIAYGSDTEKALGILRGVAESQPELLRDPAPVVFFTGFGDSALHFEVRAHCADLEALALVRHRMLLALDRELRAAGIDIPFPQREIHIRSLPDRDAGPLLDRPRPDFGEV